MKPGTSSVDLPDGKYLWTSDLFHHVVEVFHRYDGTPMVKWPFHPQFTSHLVQADMTRMARHG